MQALRLPVHARVDSAGALQVWGVSSGWAKSGERGRSDPDCQVREGRRCRSFPRSCGVCIALVAQTSRGRV
eukprot:scaffold1236_cov503-Prasinococcus_capsulatus_cf.AAC.2